MKAELSSVSLASLCALEAASTMLTVSLLLKVLLYDLRSSQPLLVKDHLYNLPIKSLNFHNQLDLVVSADSKIIKMWNKDNVSICIVSVSNILTLV